MIKVSKTVLQCVETRPRVHTFTSASSLNNNNIIGSYNYPSTCNKESLQSHQWRRTNEEIMVGYETTSKLFFLIDLFKSLYQNNTLRHKSTKTLMSPRYSNVTSSIHGYDYTICITQPQVHLFNQHIELQRVPQSFYRRVKTKTCANPYA